MSLYYYNKFFFQLKLKYKYKATITKKQNCFISENTKKSHPIPATQATELHFVLSNILLPLNVYKLNNKLLLSLNAYVLNNNLLLSLKKHNK